MSNSRRVLRILTILAIAALALGLRLRAAALLPIDFDEDDYMTAGQHYAAALRGGEWGEIVDYDYNLEHPPLNKLLYGLVFAPLPEAPEVPERPTSAPPANQLPSPHFEAGRLTSALLGSLAVLVSALLDPLGGLLLAVHSFTIKYTSQVMLEALPALTSALAVLAYARSKGRLNAWLLLSAVALGLTAAAKYLYAVAGVALLLHGIWTAWRADCRRARQLGRLAAWGLLALLVFFLADPFLWADPIGRLKASVAFNAQYAQGEQVASAGFPFWQPLVWLAQSVPWHPGVFLVSVDGLVTLLALAGVRRLWRREPVYIFWLGTALGFLLLWPTKWPQYILVLTVPLSLAAAEGARAVVWEPARSWWQGRAARRAQPRRSLAETWRAFWRESRPALLWLLPGTLVLVLIAGYPMLFQGAMSLTDFNAVAIRDGLTGGVWRAVWEGLSGQADPVLVDPFSGSRSFSRQVQYAGPDLLGQILAGPGADLLVFEVLWTTLSVGLQTALGVAVALMLHRQGLRLAGWWRALFILPWAIPEFVGALTWAQIFDPRFGALTLAGQAFHERLDFPSAAAVPLNWQESPQAALVVLLIGGVWYGFPLMMLAASAGLKLLPREVYDAAALDGAGGWGQFRWVTWPLLVPLLAPAIILRAIFAFNQFYLFYVLQPPWPLMTFTLASFFTFEEGGLYAVSAAINIVTVMALAALILVFNRWSRAAEGVSYA